MKRAMSIVISSLALFAYAKRKEIAVAAVGALAQTETRVQRRIQSFRQKHLTP